jgi:hypothetical protein
MTILIHDPVGLGESAVIVVCFVFDAWQFSPAQRRKRRREQARARVQLRRVFAEPTDPDPTRVAVLATPQDEGRQA